MGIVGAPVSIEIKLMGLGCYDRAGYAVDLSMLLLVIYDPYDLSDLQI